MNRRQSGRAAAVLLLLIALVFVAFLGVTALRVGPPPEIAIAPGLTAIGKRTPVTVTVTEPGRGLVHVRVELSQGARTESLAEKSYDTPPAWKLWAKGTASDELHLEVGRETVKGLKGGTLVIRATADRAGSWLRTPASTVRELDLPVRLTPPALELLSTATYVRQGGSEAVVYRVGDSAVQSGVRAGSWFFPGYALPGGGPGDRFALFAVPYDMGSADGIRLVAADDVGNEAQAAFIDKFFPEPPGRDKIEIGDAFMNRVVPAIMSQTPELADQGGLLENYLQINRDLRRRNNEKLVELAQASQSRFLWTRPFQQMRNSQVMARFADHRTYFYKGQRVDEQDHLGLDLATTRADAVPAANDGVVVLARFFGIFGNAVVLDHGCGLMSLYGHLSSIGVQEGAQVERGETLGRSGDTGLAGGDHLHFTLILAGLPVTPVEWWDAHWIQDRIARKLGAALPLTP